MKYFKIIIFLLATSMTLVALSSCTGKAVNTEKQSKEYTSTYICPMHCEGSGADVAGKCPVCGMDYVANEAHNKNNH